MKKDCLIEVVLKDGRHVAGRLIEETSKAICLDQSEQYKAVTTWISKAKIKRVKG